MADYFSLAIFALFFFFVLAKFAEQADLITVTLSR